MASSDLDKIEAALDDMGLRGFTCYRQAGRWMISLKSDQGFSIRWRKGSLPEAMLSALNDPRQVIPDDDESWMDLV